MKLRFSLLLISAIIFNVSMCNIAAVAQEKDSASESGPIVVEVSAIKKANIPQEVTSLGSLNASQKVIVSSEVDGRISKIYFNITKFTNDKVKGLNQSQIDVSHLPAGMYFIYFPEAEGAEARIKFVKE